MTLNQMNDIFRSGALLKIIVKAGLHIEPDIVRNDHAQRLAFHRSDLKLGFLPFNETVLCLEHRTDSNLGIRTIRVLASNMHYYTFNGYYLPQEIFAPLEASG